MVALLHIKDLAFVDPDDKMPIKTICEFYCNPCNYVLDNVTLDIVFKDFKQGCRFKHMLPIKNNQETESTYM